MRIPKLLAGTVKSFPYVLLNRAGGLAGILLQLYLFAWILWAAVFISGNADIIPELAYIRSLSYPGIPASIPPVLAGIVLPYLPVYFFWIYDRTLGARKRRNKELKAYESVRADFSLPPKMELGIGSSVSFQISNPTKSQVENIWIRAVFPECIRCDSPEVSAGSLKPGASKSVSISFVPLCAGKADLGLVDFYFEMKGKEFRKEPFSMGTHEVSCSYLTISADVPENLKFGQPASMEVSLRNDYKMSLIKPAVRFFLSKGIESDSSVFTMDEVTPDSARSLAFDIVPKIDRETSLGYFNVRFHLNGNECYVGPVDLGKRDIGIPDFDVRLNIPDNFHREVPATIGITVDNHSDVPLSKLRFTSCFSSQIECESPEVSIPEVRPNSSSYVSLSVKPKTGGKVDLGNMNISFEINGVEGHREPIYLGTHNII